MPKSKRRGRERHRDELVEVVNSPPVGTQSPLPTPSPTVTAATSSPPATTPSTQTATSVPTFATVPPPSYGTNINISRETDSGLLSKLQPLADFYNAILLTMIAPSIGEKTSPVDYLSASIGLYDELGIEEAVRNIDLLCSNISRLILLIESPGGDVASAYKIAYFLRTHYSNITTFVPHRAASGGTLIALSSNEIVMGELSNLTPIDTQVPYADTRVSVNRMSSALARLVQYYEKKRPSQVPYPYQSMVEKLDPIIYDDWNTKINAMMEYTIELLSKAGYQTKDIISIIKNFIFTEFPHSFVIHRDKARSFGVKVVPDGQYINEMNCMRWWLAQYMLESGTKHVIRYIIPNPVQQVLPTA